MGRGLQVGEDCFYEEFGFGAGDEDGGGDLQGEVVEVDGAGDVLDGLEGEAALDEALVGGLIFALELALRVGDEGRSLDTEEVEEEESGVGEGGGAELRVHGELVGGAG